MMKIAICEDDRKTEQELNLLIEKYSIFYQTPIKIFSYHNAEDLVEYCTERHCDFDIIFFDIIMDGMDGMTCARQIRQLSQTTKFIFLTSSSEYVFEGYEVNASRYILKPFHQAKIFETLHQILQEVSKVRGQTLDVKSHGKIRRVTLEEIMLIESSNNTIVLTFANQQDPITLYEKLDDLLTRVNYEFFLRIHKSYAVNFLYIETYQSDKVIMKNSIELSISRSYKASARDDFFRLLHMDDC